MVQLLVLKLQFQIQVSFKHADIHSQLLAWNKKNLALCGNSAQKAKKFTGIRFLCYFQVWEFLYSHGLVIRPIAVSALFNGNSESIMSVALINLFLLDFQNCFSESPVRLWQAKAKLLNSLSQASFSASLLGSGRQK